MTPLRKGAIGYLTKPVAQEAIDGVFAQFESFLQSNLKRVLVVEDDKALRPPSEACSSTRPSRS